MLSSDSDDDRQHYWDLMRASLMLLGIPFHASAIYRMTTDWTVASPDKSVLVTWLGELITSFRMPVFFMVAGYFSVFIMRRRGAGPWFKSRLIRLGVPLMAAAILFNPLQMLADQISAVANGLRSPQAACEILIANLTSPGRQWVRHLWFLMALLFYSAIIAMVWRYRDAPGLRIVNRSLSRASERQPSMVIGVSILAVASYLVLVVAVFFVLYRIGYSAPLNGLIDLRLWLMHAPYFVIGAVIAVNSSVHSMMKRKNKVRYAAAGICIALTAALSMLDSKAGSVAAIAVSAAASILMANLIISICAQHFNRSNRIVSKIVDASFTIYLVHHPVVSLLGAALIYITAPAELEFIGLVVATLFVSYGAHLIVARSSVLQFLFNGLLPPDRTSRRSSPAAAT